MSKPNLVRASDLENLPLSEKVAKVKDALLARHNALDEIATRSAQEGRELLASEAREAQAHRSEIEALNDLLPDFGSQIQGSGQWTSGDGSGNRSHGPVDSSVYKDDQPLTRGQSFEGLIRSKGLHLVDGEEVDLSLRKVLRGVVLGDWKDAEAEQRAMSGLTAAAGGVMIPTVLSARIIDLARAQTRVLQAGAVIVPMANRKVDVAKWAGDPEPGWRAEGSTIDESDGLLDKVTLTAKSLAVLTKATREWLEDTDGDAALMNAFARSFALKVDHAGLYGAGGDEPQGVKGAAGVNVQAIDTNGLAPTWDTLAQAVGRLRDLNEDPNAQIMADRTKRGLELQRENGSTGPYLAPPVYLDGVSRLSTSQVPTNLDEGTSVGVASDLFTADWHQLFVGVRTNLQIRVLSERYADTGHVGFVGWYRGDVAVARAEAFDVVTGLLEA
ncbi:phage major capsid protein [Knoellia sp. p5-6-4]|uniref:phage major capsid protein n=1 Tax=unclassified Knoellia TaxID=2618719 RepID=UPI0023DC6FFD|nr:phage major capsid protein [Knoellia sp. p5-6-4]MDF2146358.1 phage major capsid protein [Knoellia sp. p5-6-4]